MADRDRPGERAGSLDERIAVSRLPREGTVLRVEADQAERASLAAFLRIPAVERFAAEIVVAPWRRDGVSLKGRLEADIVQESVVTLEPVAQAIREPLELFFVPEASRLVRPDREAGGELHLDPEGDDPPDTFSGDAIELGDVLREILALALDPYPREAGADFPHAAGEAEAAIEDEKVSPFAALSRLKPGSADG